ncbi:DUF1501 domain-containing protein [Armatimonas sp.]|uniref:DUF1501 domain-containing protein n=1 Tax=Armatimonas sp. TaxID=1872638 RepID=UPI003750F93E
MNPEFERDLGITRRQFFGKSATGIGMAALASLLGEETAQAAPLREAGGGGRGMRPGEVRNAGAKAKRVVVLWQGGAPSHVDLFDYKPGLEKLRGTNLPDSVRKGTRLSTMTSGLKTFPILPAHKPFKAYGKSGMMLSELIPHIGSLADDISLINSMHTEAVNHAPGVTFLMTGSQVPGRPSMGAWATYGLGSMNKDLPSFVVMTSTDRGRTCGQLFYDYYWGSGFLPSKFQGVRFRSEGEPVLYLKNPDGLPSGLRRKQLDDIGALNAQHLSEYGDPEIETRISQYELAYKMQTSVPDLLDIGKEPAHTLERYGPDVNRPGSYARNCLLARRLLERGVRFVQLMHSGWDQHGNLPTQLAEQCRDTDQPSAALIMDLKERGLLDDTIVLWASEFGRTPFVQGDMTKPTYGRDHLGSVYSLWACGGGFKGGYVHGASDDFAYNPVKDPMDGHDLQATILHLLGIDHTKLTYRFQGRDFRLTDVFGNVEKKLIV